MKTVLKVIDFISEYTGRIISWACVVLILVLCFEVTARYVFNAPTIWAHMVGTMLGLTIISMGLAYAHKHKSHIRVDVIYSRASLRGRAIIDVVCALLLLFPLIITLLKTAAERMLYSWSMSETMIESHWFPPAYPIRTVLFVGLLLFALQGVAQFIRDVYVLVRNKPYD